MENESFSMDCLGELLFTSRSSRIYRWKENTLLKLFNPEVDPGLIRNEEINTGEAYAKGISKVKCYGQVRVGEQTGLVIERVEGKTLISLASDKPGIVFKVPELMANLQINMHNTGTSVIQSYKMMVWNALSTDPLNFLSQEDKAVVLDFLETLPDGDSILHLDYHPDNIISDTREATIIDWMTAARGAPAADIAATLYLLNEGEMIPGLNRIVAFLLESIRKLICSRYLKIYKNKTGLTDAEITPWRLPFLIVRLGIWNIASEIDVLHEKIEAEIQSLYALKNSNPGTEAGCGVMTS